MVLAIDSTKPISDLSASRGEVEPLDMTPASSHQWGIPFLLEVSRGSAFVLTHYTATLQTKRSAEKCHDL